MTKDQLIYLVMTSLNSDDVPAKKKGTIHRGDIERHLELAYSDICREVYNNAVYYRDYGPLDSMTKPFSDVSVVLDTSRGERYSILPVMPVPLPNNAGIRMIHSQCDQHLTIYYRPNNNINTIDELDVFVTGDDLFTYYVEGNRVWYDGFEGDKVSMKIVPSFSQYDDDDVVPLVGGYEGRAFDMVMQRILGKGDQPEVTNQSQQ